MKKSKRLRLLALLLAVCSIVAIVSGCNNETPTIGDPSGQQGTSTAPEPSTTIAPEPTEPTEPTEPKEEQKYYLSGTWLMNETLEPLIGLTGKTQKEEIKQEIRFYIGDVECANITWSFSYLDYEGGYTKKTLEWLNGRYGRVYAEGVSFSEFTGWGKEENRTISFVNYPVEEGEVSEEFYLWFTKNALKISDKGIIWK